MTKSDNQILTELLGGCWHEGAIAQRSNFFEQNYGQNVLYCKLCKTELESDYKNNRPTYAHADEVLIPLREKLGEERFKKFIRKISLKKHIDYAAYDEEPDKVSFVPMSTYEFINAYIINPPALLKKAIEFLEGEK